jgi:hypothetical protein
MNSDTERSALSVRQPWAELLISGRKSMEIRTWAPDYRGRLWLHAGSKMDPRLERQFGLEGAYKGGFIGSIQLAAVVPLTSDRWTQWRQHHLDTGQYRDDMLAWIMESPRRFHTPVPGSGRLGIFKVSDDIFQQLATADANAWCTPLDQAD